MLSRFIAAFAAFVALAPAGQADTIDFGEVGSGFQSATFLALSNVDIVTDADDLFVYGPGAGEGGVNGGFCAIIGTNCLGNAAIGFNAGTVSNLSFEVFGFDLDDGGAASIFDAADSLLGSVAITADGVVSFGAISGIASLVLINTSLEAGGGIAYRDFSFTEDTTSPPAVPLPAALPFLLTALGTLALARRRG